MSILIKKVGSLTNICTQVLHFWQQTHMSTIIKFHAKQDLAKFYLEKIHTYGIYKLQYHVLLYEYTSIHIHSTCILWYDCIKSFNNKQFRNLQFHITWNPLIIIYIYKKLITKSKENTKYLYTYPLPMSSPILCRSGSGCIPRSRPRS